MAFVISVSFPIPIPRFQCRGLQIALLVATYHTQKYFIKAFHYLTYFEENLPYERLPLAVWEENRIFKHQQKQPPEEFSDVKKVSLETRAQAYNFIKKETLAQMFSCEFCEISKNTFFTEHLRTTASASTV